MADRKSPDASSDGNWVSPENWNFVQSIRGTSVPYPWTNSEPSESDKFAADITGRRLQRPNSWSPDQAAAGELHEANWDSAKHPRGGFSQNRGWFSPSGGVGTTALHQRGVNGEFRPQVQYVGFPKRKAGNKAVNPPTSITTKPPASVSGTAPKRTVNDEGIEVAGDSPETTESYQSKVQAALDILDPDIGRWWKARSVASLVRARKAGLFGPKHRSWLDEDGHPTIEVDKSYTPGETAQAIIDDVKSSLDPQSIGHSFKGYNFARTGNPEEFLRWRQEAGDEAVRQATNLAELYITSVATLTPSGDLVVSLGDLADHGPRWNQLISVLPLVAHLPIGAVFLKLGQRTAKIPNQLVRTLEKLAVATRKKILALAARAKNDEEAADIIKREVVALVGDGQIHHPISAAVHDALEKHPLLKGKYQARDPRFEALAKDLASHKGYQEWHRKVDTDVAEWIARNKDATEGKFEAYLRSRYSDEDLRKRFPNSF